MANVFISYAREDLEFAQTLRDALATKHKVWADWTDIPFSASWPAEIRTAIEASDVLVFVITSASVASEMCRKEFAHAKRSRKRVITVLRQAARGIESLPALKAIQWIPLREEDDFEAGVTAIMVAIHLDLDWLRDHTRLLQRARAWRRKRREQSLLLRGKELEEAIHWLARAPELSDIKPTLLHAEFIEHSQRHEASERDRLEGLYRITLARQLAAQALLARNAADYQKPMTANRAEELAALQGLEVTDSLSSLERGVLLAAESLRLSESVEADTAVRECASILRRASRRLAHPEFVDAVLYSADGQYLATSGWDGVARVWQLSTWTQVAELRNDLLRGITFSPDCRYFATFGPREGKVWHVGRWKVVGRFAGASAAEFSPDGRLLVTLQDNRCSIRTTEGHSDADATSLECDVTGISISPDGQTLATLGCPNDLRFWRLPAGQLLATLAEASVVGSVLFSPDNRTVATITDDGAMLWATDSRERLAHLVEGATPWALVFSPDGRQLVVAGGPGCAAHVWDVARGAEVLRIGERIRSLGACFSPDGLYLATRHADSIVRIWDVVTGSVVGILAHSNSVSFVAFSRDGSEVATAGKESVVRVWPIREQNLGKMHPERGCRAIAFSPDVQLLAVADTAGTIKLWDTNLTGIVSCLHYDDTLYSMTFSRDGRLLVVCGADTVSAWNVEHHAQKNAQPIVTVQAYVPPRVSIGPDAAIVLAETTTVLSIMRLPSFELLGRLEHPEGIGLFALSPDGRWLVSGGREAGPTSVWDLASRRIVARVLHRGLMNDVVFAADSSLFAITAGTNVLVARSATGEITNHLGHVEEAYHGAFSPDGKYVVCTSADDCAYVHNLSTGGCRSLRHGEFVESTAFSPNGQAIATASKDGTVRVWRLRDAHEVVRLSIGSRASQVSFSADNKWLVTVAAGRARFDLWLPEDVAAEACGRTTRNLTHEEWREYLGPEPYRKTCGDIP